MKKISYVAQSGEVLINEMTDSGHLFHKWAIERLSEDDRKQYIKDTSTWMQLTDEDPNIKLQDEVPSFIAWWDKFISDPNVTEIL